MAKQKRPTQEEFMRAFERSMERVDEYIRMRAKRDGGVWAHPWIPYYRLMGDLWAQKHAVRVKPVSGERANDLRAEVAMVQSYDVADQGYRASNDLYEAKDAAAFIADHTDLGTVDVELLDKRSEGNGDMDDYYRVFRVGDRKVVTLGDDIITVEQLRAQAEGLREEAASFDRMADLVGEPACPSLS